MPFEISVEVVGVDIFRNLSDPNQWEQMKSKLLNDIGILSVKSIRDEIRNRQWKSSPESLINSTTFAVDYDSVAVRIGDSGRGHGYAFYQEFGVERHEMRYLLKSTKPIPLMIGSFKKGSVNMGVMIFRKATERWMGRPHTIESPTKAKIGKLVNGRLVKPKTEMWSHPTYQATGWVHPGYPGKFFFREGIKNAMVEVTKQIRGLSFRVAYADPYYDLRNFPGNGG